MGSDLYLEAERYEIVYKFIKQLKREIQKGAFTRNTVEVDKEALIEWLNEWDWYWEGPRRK